VEETCTASKEKKINARDVRNPGNIFDKLPSRNQFKVSEV
jgi:hypothetical protein